MTQPASITPPAVAAEGFETGQQDAANPAFVPAPASAATSEPSTARYTSEDLAAARKQEKDKLYSEITDLKDIVASLKSERDAEKVAIAEREQRIREEAEAAARAKAESETDVRTLLQQKEQEWSQKIEAEKAERERAFALLEAEKNFQALSQYRQQALAAASDDIVPELIDMVTGDSPEQIDASIEGLKARSAAIMANVAAAAQQQRQSMPGTRVTAPAMGPLDNDPANKTYSPEDIKNMSISEYEKVRSKLIGQTRSGGIFG